ncbi:SPOR domain-containing protein [Albidovulum aquaemixtae]|uniref:SPOR domain-containing protein n=1 Tax=Albidovulum aquaemixtae TaxID=1542388 RepID=UPI001C634C4D|nr:SPOR domain-containing protein [Defluviimonas aquaemixtae]
MIRVVLAALVAVAGTGTGAQAQVGGPREAPPADYAGNQYVDSGGCAFVRAGIGGQVTWIPRLGRDRQPVCGLEPSLSAGAAPAAQPEAPSPTPSAPATAEATVRAAAAPAAAVMAAPAKKRARKAAPTGTRLVRVRTVGKAATYCVEGIDAAQRYLLSDGRRVTQCAEETEGEPVAYLNGLGVPGLTVEPNAPRAADARRAEKADRGDYRVVWSNGKLSPAGQAAKASGRATGSTKASASGHGARYVQVGAYAEPANADRAVAGLKAMGLPVATAREHVGRKPVRTVLAGPFADDAALAAALTTARRNGYADAFARR